MELLRDNFERSLPMLEEAINECDFMAIDIEFTGLDPRGQPTPRSESDNIQERYEKVRQQAQDFIPCQFGLCTFRWDDERSQYESRPFNIYLMPASSGIRGAKERWFQCQASTMEFLAKNGFDFTKWLGHGVHFMNWEEEEYLVRKKERQLKNDLPEIELDERGLAFERKVREQINTWIDDKSAEEYILINCNNSYQSRIVHQVIKKYYPNFDSIGQKGFVYVSKLNQEVVTERTNQLRKRYQQDIQNAIGFRRAIDLISKSNKPVVGHHMIMDVCQVYQNMYKELPRSVHIFAGGLLALFPKMFDTKFMAESIPFVQKLFRDTKLDNMNMPSLWPQFIQSIPIVPNLRFQRYVGSIHNHEAGYDAMCTGTTFIRIYHMLVQHRYNPNFDKMMERDSYRRMDYGYHQRRNEMAENYRPPPRLGGRIFHNDTIPDILQEFLNKLFFVKSSAIRAYDIAYIRATSDDPEIEREADRFKRYFYP